MDERSPNQVCGTKTRGDGDSRSALVRRYSVTSETRTLKIVTNFGRAKTESGFYTASCWAQCRFEWKLTSRTLPALLHGGFAGCIRNGIIGAVKGVQSRARRTLDCIEKVFTLKGLGLDAGSASSPRACPAARTSPPSGEFTRSGSITFPTPRKAPLETALSPKLILPISLGFIYAF